MQKWKREFNDGWWIYQSGTQLPTTSLLLSIFFPSITTPPSSSQLLFLLCPRNLLIPVEVDRLPDCQCLFVCVCRYVKLEDRKRALVSRLLQYALVHQVLGIPFEEITINRTIEGKPYLVCLTVKIFVHCFGSLVQLYFILQSCQHGLSTSKKLFIDRAQIGFKFY